MIESLEAKFADGIHVAIARHSGMFLMVTSLNPKAPTFIDNPLLRIIFNADMPTEQRQQLVYQFCKGIGL